MKILHFISGVRGGGVEQVLINYTHFLNMNDNTDELIAYQHAPIDVCAEKLKASGNSLVQIADKRKHPIKNLADSYKLMRTFKPDIVHAHMSLLNFFPLFIARLCGVKVRISHAHISRNNVSPKLVPVFKRLNLLFANRLVACGNDAGHYLYGSHPFWVMKNAIDLSNFSYSESRRKSFRNRLHITDNQIVLGHIGRFVVQKNHKRLLEIFGALLQQRPDSIMVLAGDGEKMDEIKKQVKMMQIESNVRILGSISNPAELYDAIDCFVLPSLYEGLPVVGIEAQAAGVPCLFSNTIDRDIRLLPTTKLIALENSNQEWVESILELIHDGRVSSNTLAKILISEGYKIELAAKQLDKYYQHVMEG
ncbi:glycosyltransferase family 1 protein [Weissella cibaria]|jgi:glycosyltransferase involved in cell wall biosynthesis|uniref:glycosyltransferase family 1 protein n=1 Tax=Weissella cibaria TaxID=137591 RepID=UPI0011317F73|nr:glycosyltransferase family 1 protein [Weissella cibaria]QDG81996.1 glycosyltransferase family 1 protein [Weissella cibaria]